MFGDPRLGTQESLLFPTPQRQADRPSHPGADLLHESPGLECGRRSVLVGGRPDAYLPRLEMPADHDDLVANRRLGSRELLDHVVGFSVSCIVKTCLDVDAELDWNI